MHPARSQERATFEAPRMCAHAIRCGDRQHCYWTIAFRDCVSGLVSQRTLRVMCRRTKSQQIQKLRGFSFWNA